ncbi:hypothetical protein JD844_007033 [Phrynosoma platyrhinos]|uniref:Claudin n=1 Tax=Phrynosoma platyrhinos TaxID=52577 RepID=A0ABQ7T2B7_PHRPL|nr:hypothetical protein JD844_007033 [Phrynosoma platyrhinos]
MTSTAIQISALVLAFLGLILLHTATVNNNWKYSTSSTQIITASWINEGLWKSCVATSFGSVQCKTFPSLLILETYIQVCRALMITSLILGLSSMIAVS